MGRVIAVDNTLGFVWYFKWEGSFEDVDLYDFALVEYMEDFPEDIVMFVEELLDETELSTKRGLTPLQTLSKHQYHPTTGWGCMCGVKFPTDVDEPVVGHEGWMTLYRMLAAHQIDVIEKDAFL